MNLLPRIHLCIRDIRTKPFNLLGARMVTQHKAQGSLLSEKEYNLSTFEQKKRLYEKIVINWRLRLLSTSYINALKWDEIRLKLRDIETNKHKNQRESKLTLLKLKSGSPYICVGTTVNWWKRTTTYLWLRLRRFK